MDLGELREKFIQFSGRDDLINSDNSDNGADYLINAGQRFLDRRIDFRKSSGVVFKSLAIDSWYLNLELCRSVEKVWVVDTEERWQLEKKELSWLYTNYDSLISGTDSGAMKYWSIANLRGINVERMDSLGTFFNHTLSQGVSEELTGIVVLPPTDVALVLEVWGKFYSPPLKEDGDTSWWTQEADDILLMAALYKMEVFYRNTEGAKDWLNGIDLDLSDIDKDQVHEDNASKDQLEG
jgi:hypothetical protein